MSGHILNDTTGDIVHAIIGRQVRLGPIELFVVIFGNIGRAARGIPDAQFSHRTAEIIDAVPKIIIPPDVQ